ncbi:hypothetical protein [Brevundimonas sp.]|uniref:hypothetical protein n=1 Tax=Brevundimonas sp. TaxID=1871086 RepID=UPI002ABA03A1|nr:hypothetical protein [Brevundimonas sp.]MDZ4364922.1 hypothetical protein [Brevundimonas sp.]
MTQSRSTTPARQYAVRTFAFMGGYTAIMLLMITGALDPIVGTAGAWLLAAAVTMPVLGQTWAVLAFMRDSDEFMRAVMAKRFIVAAGLAISLFAGWGFAEAFAGAPHMEGYIVYALFWGCFGLVTPFIRSSQ